MTGRLRSTEHARWTGHGVARIVTIATIALSPCVLRAQQPATAAERLRQQRDSLEKIRSERAELQRRLNGLQTTAHDLSEEKRNLEQQAAATARAVHTLDQQLVALGDEEHDATASLVRTQDELAIKRSILRHRVREIYKRGALYSTEALLSAQSFGELVARYKYLHLVALRDRVLVGRVEALGTQIAGQRETLVRLHDDVEASRQEKADEEKRLLALEQQRGRSLVQTQASQQKAEARLAQIAKDEARLASVITTLDAERRRTEGRSASGNIVSTSTLRTSDFGKLDWPVEGNILYSFGRVVNPNNTTTRWNGVGIGAPDGTPVKAVAAGTVALAETFGTYGLTVILHHGSGDYSVYGSLSKLQVAAGAKVAKGQVIGLVGKTDPDLGAHLHFEVRPNTHPVDPLEWLRSRR